jgi:hypothetical protein
MRVTLRFLLVVVLIAAVMTPFISGNRARAAMSLRVSPALIELRADPGAHGDQPINVENNGDETVSVSTGVEAYKQATGDWSAVDWLQAEPGNFSLKPGESRQIDVQIDVPDGLKTGGRYALVTFTTGGDKTQGNGASIAGKIGVAFLMTVDGKGKFKRNVDVDHFAPVLEADGRVGFQASLRNDGNIHANPQGVVTVLDAQNKPYGSLEIPLGTALLPGDQTMLTADGSLPMASDAEYHAEAAIDYGAKKDIKTEIKFRPIAKLAVTGISVCENLDRGPTVTVGLQNQGELGLTPPLQLELRGATGSTTPQPNPPQIATIWPGEQANVAMDVSDRLPSGQYTIHLRADYSAPDANGQTVLPPVEQDYTFSIGGSGGDTAPLCA